MLKVMGIDCGSRFNGYAIVGLDGSKPVCLDYGVITCKTSKKYPDLDSRLKYIHGVLYDIISHHGIKSCGIEDVYVGNNARTAIILAQVMGICKGICFASKIPCEVYKPSSIRKSIMRKAMASKLEASAFISRQYNLPIGVEQDAMDALAVATCELYHRSSLRELT